MPQPGNAEAIRWLCVTELLDPTVELHQAFFSERLPHPKLAEREATLQWLRRCGMCEALARSAFANAATKVHDKATACRLRGERLPIDLLQQAEQVASAIVSCYSLLSDDAAQPGEPPLDEWLRGLGQLRVARPFAMPPRVFIEAPSESVNAALAETPRELLQLCQSFGGPADALVPFAGNCIPLETSHTHILNAACWSRTTVLHVPNARHVPSALVHGLGAEAAPTIEHVCQHTIFICSQPEATLRTWQRDQRDLWLEGRSRVGRAGSFKQQLEMATYVTLATSEPTALQSYLQDAPIVLLESAYSEAFHFVQPSRVFVDLTYGAPPYAYPLRDVGVSFGRYRLHSLLDCPRTPTLDQCATWLEDMSRHANGAPLRPQQLRSAQNLADLAGLKIAYGSATLPGTRPLPLPDREGRLQPSTHLLVDDAPWLDGRVDKSGTGYIPVVHSSLTTSTALRLGARRLSSAVMELPDGPLTPVAPGDLERLLGPAAAPALNSQLVVWNTNLRARALRVSVRRAV